VPIKEIDTYFNIYDTTLSNTGYSYPLRLLVPLRVPNLQISCDRTFI